MTAKPIPLDRIRALLDYDPATGTLTWKQKPHHKSCVKIGSIAGCVTPTAVIVKIDQSIYKVHRIVWALERGEPVPAFIDHEDTNVTHNWIGNLRAATVPQNGANVGMYSTNKSGVKGVCWYAAIGKWRATVGRKCVGDFDTLEEAARARRAAFQERYGEFARH